MTSNSTPNTDALNTNDAAALRSDSLAMGVVFMLSMTVVQRFVGFGRSVLFCRFLDDDQLGVWSLAFSFLLMAAPLAVLGLPGSFGRYVEHFRQRGQLRAFLRRTTLVTVLLSMLATGALFLFRERVAWLVFKDPSQGDLVLLLGVTFAAVLGFNFLIELLTALRKIRIVSLMQFTNSFIFAVAGLSLMWLADWGAEAAVVAYGAGCVTAILFALLTLRRLGQDIAPDNAPLAQRSLWSKLLPLAGWIWVINLLANLFDAVDRYMILHFAQASVQQAQAIVGQYHSSRVVPMLLVAVAGMLSSILLPYLSQDWEAGRRKEVSRRINLALKLTAVGFSAVGAMLLVGAPLLFSWILGGKYDDGLTVLPWTLTYCVWFSLAMIAQNYLWCAEKARLASLALFVGLAVNIVLNLILLPMFGLLGAVLATAVGNALALVLIYRLNRRLGMQIDRGVWLASGLPLLFCLGPWQALAGVSLVALAAIFGNWLFAPQEKQELIALILQIVEKPFKRIRSCVLST